MKYIKQIKKIASKNKKSQSKKAIDYIKSKIESAAEDGETLVGVWVNSFKLSQIEHGRVVGTLKRLGFKIKSGFDYETGSYTCSFIVSWK